MSKKIFKPESPSAVYEVMRDYNLEKHFNYSDSKLHYIAEDMYLYFSGKEWENVKYWPALAKRWLLNTYNRDQYKSKNKYPKKNKPKSTAIRDILLEQAGIDDE